MTDGFESRDFDSQIFSCWKISRALLAAVAAAALQNAAGISHPECQYQKLVPYHLATPHHT